jgi:hypothetical protein
MAFRQCRRGVKQEREQQALGLGKLEGALEGTTVISATGARDEDVARELGAIPVRYVPAPAGMPASTIWRSGWTDVAACRP